MWKKATNVKALKQVIYMELLVIIKGGPTESSCPYWELKLWPPCLLLHHHWSFWTLRSHISPKWQVPTEAVSTTRLILSPFKILLHALLVGKSSGQAELLQLLPSTLVLFRGVDCKCYCSNSLAGWGLGKRATVGGGPQNWLVSWGDMKGLLGTVIGDCICRCHHLVGALAQLLPTNLKTYLLSKSRHLED